MSNNGVRPLAQRDEVMFERNLARTVSRRQAIILELLDRDNDIEVFVAGLDDKWMQVCDIRTGELKLVARGVISSIRESSVTLDSLSEDLRQDVESKVGTFVSICYNHSQKG